MSYLSLFVLTLWVFLQSGAGLGWFTVDSKLVGIVGMAFVIIVIVETIVGAAGKLPAWYKKPAPEA